MERKSIIEACKYVDYVFYEESLELKRQYCLEYKAGILVMGDDWIGCFDNFKRYLRGYLYSKDSKYFYDTNN